MTLYFLLGMMAARGMLENPAMFLGNSSTPVACIQDWVNISLDLGVIFNCFHHHLVFMMEHILTKDERRVFNCLKTKDDVLNFLKENYNITYIPGNSGFSADNDVITCNESSDRENNHTGSFFTSSIKKYEVQDEVLDSLGGLYD